MLQATFHILGRNLAVQQPHYPVNASPYPLPQSRQLRHFCTMSLRAYVLSSLKNTAFTGLIQAKAHPTFQSISQGVGKLKSTGMLDTSFSCFSRKIVNGYLIVEN